MNTWILKAINFVLWGSAILLLFIIALNFPAFYPYLATLFDPDAMVMSANLAAAPLVAGDDLLLALEATPVPPTVMPTVKLTPIAQLTLTETISDSISAEVWLGLLPSRVKIPVIELDAPVVVIGQETTEVNGVAQAVWDVPDWRAAGWHNTSARIGVPGNSVFNGHNTTKGEVFRDLYMVQVDDLVFVEMEDGNTRTYQVAERLILPEAGQPLEVRIENARYILPTEDERLTMVTCHPYGSLANRLLVIAYPVSQPDQASTGGE